MDDGGDQEEREEAGDHGLVGHPEAVLVEPQGVIQPLAEIRLAPSSLLVEPTQILGRCLSLALRSRREFSLIAKAEHPIGEVAVITEAALGAQEGLMVPGLQEALEQRVPIHPQRSADTLDAPKVGLAGPLDVEGHPVPHAAEEGDPGVVLVKDLEDRKEDINQERKNKELSITSLSAPRTFKLTFKPHIYCFGSSLLYCMLPARLRRPLPPLDLPRGSSAFLWYMLDLELCPSHTPEKDTSAGFQ